MSVEHHYRQLDDGSYECAICGDKAESASESPCVDCGARHGERCRLRECVNQNISTLEDKLRDATSALAYIHHSYGELYGVGWDRVLPDRDKTILPTGEQP